MRTTPKQLAIVGVSVLVLVSSSACIFWSQAEKGKKHADELVLQEQLKKIREAIRSYVQNKGVPPQELSDLVRADYLPIIPLDPITNKSDWVIVSYECPTSPCMKGIKDVHSSSKLTSSDGRPYEKW
jgi:general secretion pathway protein G